MYVHFPWCLKRCAYCDFATSVAKEIPRHAYCEALITDLQLRTRTLQPRPIATVFFGGGTPSLWGAPYIAQVLQWLHNWAGLAPDAEVTLEANPGAAEAGDLRAYAAAGINRFSVGIQALDAARLRALDRVHDVQQARATLQIVGQMLNEGSLRSASADLIFGVPGQTVPQLADDVSSVLDYGLPHLSAYALTVEPGTPLARAVAAGKQRAPDDDVQAQMLDALPGLVAGFGVARYEVSNYAKPGHHSRHNWAYWSGDHYLGVGVGAHGFLPAAQLCGQRYANTRSTQKYLAKLGCGELATDFCESINAATHTTELLLTGLRLTRGVDLARLDRTIGAGTAQQVVDRARDKGLLGHPMVSEAGFLRVCPDAVHRLDSLVAAVTE